MKLQSLVLACALVSSSALAAPWDTTDKVLFGSFLGLQIADGLQTYQVHKHPDQFRETNPLLGSDPSAGKIILLKSAISALVYWGVKDSSSSNRKFLLTAADLFYLGVVGHNYQVGIRIHF